MFDLPKYGDGVCLARMAELLDALAVDRARLQRISVAVTGSNGKGSTAAFCAGIARAYGLRTGLFTSPHLYRVNERFQVDGVPAGDDELAPLVARIESRPSAKSRSGGLRNSARSRRCSRWPACISRNSNCEFAVFEAGIGGRYDPVRLAGALAVGVASVDYEHVELLGNSLELIASDKSDACATGGTIVYGENCRRLRPHLLEYHRYRGITSIFIRDQIAITGESAAASRQRLDFRFGAYEFRSLEMRLLGAFQFNNAAIAVTLFLLWLHRTRPGTAAAAIRSRGAVRPARHPLARPP